MKLNHLGVVVTDVLATRTFLETYFGLTGIGKANRRMTHLHDEDGFALSLFAGEQASEIHIGFIQETQEAVDAIYERLRSDGFDVKPPQLSHGWTFYVTAPGGLIVEVVC
ncbi:VOC family protein [Deinococcus puniceus]|uniref:Glyoxalase n=1 Tax=Deinococcus puniceus TaxID=1182568 RepID=A0A172T8C4_9DEIO|nr:VOC family protein [Deinococcus puniceus]ANE43197.1 glyoxalase [Deinococcus puniceus]